MKGVYPKLALCGSKHECARSDIVFLHLSEVSKGMVSLQALLIKNIDFRLFTWANKLGYTNFYDKWKHWTLQFKISVPNSSLMASSPLEPEEGS